MNLRFFHVFSWLDTSCLLISKYYFITWMYCSLFMHLRIEEHLSCFQVFGDYEWSWYKISVYRFLCNIYNIFLPSFLVFLFFKSQFLYPTQSNSMSFSFSLDYSSFRSLFWSLQFRCADLDAYSGLQSWPGYVETGRGRAQDLCFHHYLSLWTWSPQGCQCPAPVTLLILVYAQTTRQLVTVVAAGRY